MKTAIKALLKLFIGLDNFCYRVINKLVVWDNDGFHPKHRILNYHRFFTENIASGDRVLDIGCGNGALSFDIAGRARAVVGIDNKEKNISAARAKFSKDNLNFVFGDALTYKFDGRFDKVVLSNVLEHISDRVGFLRQLHGLTETILLRVPMLTRDWLTVYKKENGSEYRLDRTHFIEYCMEDLAAELMSAGWRLEQYNITFGELWGVLKNGEL